MHQTLVSSEWLSNKCLVFYQVEAETEHGRCKMVAFVFREEDLSKIAAENIHGDAVEPKKMTHSVQSEC